MTNSFCRIMIAVSCCVLSLAISHTSYCQQQAPKLSATDRIVGLTTLYHEVRYNFANWDNVPDLDWEKAFRDYLPKVETAQTDIDYYFTLMKFLALLHDGHTRVWPPKYVLDQLDLPPLTIQPIEGKAIIVAFAATDEIRQAAIVKGMEITRVDGRPVKELLETDVFPTVAASTSQARDLECYRRTLLGQKGTKVRIEVRDIQGQSRGVSITRNMSQIPRDLYPKEWDAPSLLEHKAFENGIHYFALNSFSDQKIVGQFDSLFSTLGSVRGLIIDVRKNTGGSDGTGYEIISRLIAKATPTSLVHSLQYVPFNRVRFGANIHKYWLTFDKGEITPHDGKTYQGPLVVLTSATTASAAEDFLIPLVRSKRAIVVGQGTAGSTGLPLEIDLPGGGWGYLCTATDYYPGSRKWIGAGVVPDIEVQPTLDDFLNGRDPVLQTGLEILKKKI